MRMETYLGDGLYGWTDGNQIRLYTQEGNEVFLDSQVLEKFLKWVDFIKTGGNAVASNA